MSDSPWTFAAESSRTGATDTVTLIDGSTFMLCARSGDIAEHRIDGLFMLDTRVLSRWELRVGGRPIEPLSVTPDGPFGATFVGRVGIATTEALVAQADTDDGPHNVVDSPFVVVQRRYVGRGVREDLEIRNHGDAVLDIEVVLTADADFANLFDVKAGRSGSGATMRTTPTRTPTGLRLEAPTEGATAVEATLIHAFPRPDHVGINGTIVWTIRVDAGGTWRGCLEVCVRAGGADIEPAWRCGAQIEHAVPVARLRSWRHSASRITTGHAALGAAVTQSVDDLGALRIFDPAHAERTVVAAGAPWFMTLFGRDSLLTSWMALPVDHDLALGVLGELADAQGSEIDPVTEEEPGRILHEVRFDKLSARLLGGNGRYYGSIDATPLFIMLTAELARWIGPSNDVAALMPAVDRAVSWIDDFGDRDGDGFVEYLRSDPGGLEQQGWKDSWDGIRHADGSVATPPIALCEVQGYVYAAFKGRAALARAFGEPEEQSRRFDDRAEVLRERFDAAFWCDDLQTYAVGLDSEKVPIRSLTSNIGHLLWTGIVPEGRARALATHLTSPEMFSGWGVRTLASTAAGYNPLSYHCGSVWPHDTAIAVAGLARYGFDDAMHTLAMGLIDASTSSGGRLPELFGGFERSDIRSPVPYPASCSPQAWAAAAPLLIVRSLLGLEPDVPAGRVSVRPRLPDAIDHLQLLDLPLGGALVDVVARHAGVDVTVTAGDIEVVRL